MKSLVTGGAGFIGSNLVDQLVKTGHQVIVLDNLSTGQLSNLNQVKKKIDFVNVDVSNSGNSISQYFENVDWVFHLAGLADIVPSIKNPYNYFQTNVQGTLNVLEASKKEKIKKFRDEEIHHKNIAYDNGASKEGLYYILDKIIKTGSKVAINISEKI